MGAWENKFQISQELRKKKKLIMRKKIESNKKLLFWFSVDKTLYQNNFKHIAFFVTLSEGYSYFI